jgi:hypothetical protein
MNNLMAEMEKDAAKYPDSTTYYRDLRIEKYPSVKDQLDMMYHDAINGTTNWVDTIAEIKNSIPKN